MSQQIGALAPHDLIGVIRQVQREIAAGLDIGDPVSVTALAHVIEANIAPRIVPDRRYSIRECEPFGFCRSTLYARHKALIRKDGRKSFVLGRDLLAAMDAAPTLAAVASTENGLTTPPSAVRRRGRPRKSLDGSASRATEPSPTTPLG